MNATTRPEVRFATVDGLHIRYADSGIHRRPTILLTSPWPESLYCFSRIWPALAEQARVFAVDLPGFGASAARHDVQSPRAMGAFLARLIVDANLGAPYIVAPDVGAPAALFAAAQHPDRVSGLILDAGTTAVPFERGESRAIASAVIDTIAARISGEILDDYTGCYTDERLAESVLYLRNYRAELPALTELLPQIASPVTIINGRRDRDVPLSYAIHLQDQLPNGRVVVVNAGHFAWEEAPLEYSAVIVDAIRDATPLARAA